MHGIHHSCRSEVAHQLHVAAGGKSKCGMGGFMRSRTNPDSKQRAVHDHPSSVSQKTGSLLSYIGTNCNTTTMCGSTHFSKRKTHTNISQEHPGRQKINNTTGLVARTLRTRCCCYYISVLTMSVEGDKTALRRRLRMCPLCGRRRGIHPESIAP